MNERDNERARKREREREEKRNKRDILHYVFRKHTFILCTCRTRIRIVRTMERAAHEMFCFPAKEFISLKRYGIVYIVCKMARVSVPEGVLQLKAE